MVLPLDFKLHEQRFSRDMLEGIKFQFDRLDLNSQNLKVFLDKYLKISKSPTLPADNPEVLYLAAKVAYLLADYEFFNSKEFQERYIYSDGAKIWFALAKAARGEVDDSLKILTDILQRTEENGDHLQRIECLGILAQILFIRGSEYKYKLETILEKIDFFKEKMGNINDFDHMFLPAYLIKSRITSQQITQENIVNEISTLLTKAEKAKDTYYSLQFQLDLAQAFISTNNLLEAQKNLDLIFKTLIEIKYKALEAKAIRIQGQLKEANADFDLAEKNYLKAKQIYTTLEDQIGIASCVTRLAQLAEKQEQQNKAEQYYQEAYSLSEKISDFLGMANTLSALARLTSKRGQYSEAYQAYIKVLKIAYENNFNYLLPSIYEGLAYVNFISGDFDSAVKNRHKALEYKEKFNYDLKEILMDRVKLGEINAIVGNLTEAFIEFETALNLCSKLQKKDDIYFDILNWLFEISTAIGKYSLAETYIGRADLFASIHDSQEENAQALISRIRFLLQKKELEQAEKLLAIVFEQAQEFPSALTMALALIEKSSTLILKFIDNRDNALLEPILQSLDDMLFISLDIEFLPLTMYTKKVLAKILAYKSNYDEGLEELEEAVDLAKELGMKKFEDILQKEMEELEEMKATNDSIQDVALEKRKENFLSEALDFIHQTFWLVSASEHQRV
ncbi:MAG: hypothetical protein JXA54_00445 [Candidatus Heimdallarchaeota archaeon]|nr:hypothetical protein [Candidatus Heimdallarchaeota archaeon]